MWKRCSLVGGILLLVSLLLVGCGIPREDYDAVVAERDSAQTELQSVKAELTASRASVSELTSSLGKATAELQAAKECMSSAKSRAEIVNAFFVPVMTGELEQMSDSKAIDYFLGFRNKVESSEDPLLLDKFDALKESEGKKEE